MPQNILIASECHEDEIRVYDDKTDEGSGIHVYGPSARLRRYACCFFTDPQSDGEPGFLDRLEKEGYDPKSMVFSILKKGVSRKVDGTVSNEAFEEALAAIQMLKNAVENGEQAKGTIVFHEEEIETIRRLIEDGESAIGKALAASAGAARI